MRKLAISAGLLLGISAVSGAALASNGLESPENGAYQIGRGGAWLARADDPLAVYFNPAGLVRQATGVHLGASLMFKRECYSPLGQDNDNDSPTYGQYGAPVSPGNSYPGPGYVPRDADDKQVGPAAAICAKSDPFPNPQIAANFRVLDQLAIGFGVLGPHAVGGAEWPEELTFTNRFGVEATQPAAQRYMLVKSDSKIFFPTLSLAYAFNDQLAVGAGFTWGIAIAEFENFSEVLSPAPEGNMCGPNNDQVCVAGNDYSRDAKAKLTTTDIFVPGFVIGAIYSPTSNLDVAGWFRWSDAVDSDASVNVTASYWDNTGKKNEDPCPADNPECNLHEG